MSGGHPNQGNKSGSPQQIERTRWSRTVNLYMSALNNGAHASQRDPEKVAQRLLKLDNQIEAAMKRGTWHLVARYTQRRIDLEESGGFGVLEEDFTAIIAPYSEVHDISYAAWRQLGVPVGVLSAGGMEA